MMEVVRWEEEQTIVVEHVGAVKGYGRFEIGPVVRHRDALGGGPPLPLVDGWTSGAGGGPADPGRIWQGKFDEAERTGGAQRPLKSASRLAMKAATPLPGILGPE